MDDILETVGEEKRKCAAKNGRSGTKAGGNTLARVEVVGHGWNKGYESKPTFEKDDLQSNRNILTGLETKSERVGESSARQLSGDTSKGTSVLLVSPATDSGETIMLKPDLGFLAYGTTGITTTEFDRTQKNYDERKNYDTVATPPRRDVLDIRELPAVPPTQNEAMFDYAIARTSLTSSELPSEHGKLDQSLSRSESEFATGVTTGALTKNNQSDRESAPSDNVKDVSQSHPAMSSAFADIKPLSDSDEPKRSEFEKDMSDPSNLSGDLFEKLAAASLDESSKL